MPRLLIPLLVALSVPGVAPAQEAGTEGVVSADGVTAEAADTEGEVVAEFDEELVVVGSRARPRSVTESSVPIDAIPIEDVVSQGASTLDYQFGTWCPRSTSRPIRSAAPRRSCGLPVCAIWPTTTRSFS